MDFKGIFVGRTWTEDEYTDYGDPYGYDVHMETRRPDAVVMHMVTESGKVLRLRVPEPYSFGAFCDRLKVGTRVCVSADSAWELDGVVSFKGDIHSYSTVSHHALQPDGTAAYLCHGYCAASERNEREFGRSGVCDANAPKLAPDVPGAVKSSFLEQVMKLMPADERMRPLRFPNRRDTTGFSFVRENGTYAFFKVETYRKGDFHMISRHAKADGQMLAPILIEMQDRRWVDNLGIEYRFTGFTFHGQGQARVRMGVDTEDSAFTSTHGWAEDVQLSIWLVSEFEEDDSCR